MNTARRRTYECLLCGKVYLHKKTSLNHWQNHLNKRDSHFMKWLKTKRGREWAEDNEKL